MAGTIADDCNGRRCSAQKVGLVEIRRPAAHPSPTLVQRTGIELSYFSSFRNGTHSEYITPTRFAMSTVGSEY